MSECDRPVVDWRLAGTIRHLRRSVALEGGVKRVNLLEYFELADAIQTARAALGGTTAKAGNVWFATYSLAPRMSQFANDDNGFTTCKRVAAELAEMVRSFHREHITDDKEEFSSEKLDEELFSWQYRPILNKIEVFKNVFSAECADVAVYTVGQVSIYRTSALVANGSEILPPEVRSSIPEGATKEFDDAGRCLAFDLPTACGFHALRALELTMDWYLRSFGVETSGMKSWNDYISAAKELVDDEASPCKPSPKVHAMLDRMRQLDRNPLMHPRDTLDQVSANHLFQLSAITAGEMAKDASSARPQAPLLVVPEVA